MNLETKIFIYISMIAVILYVIARYRCAKGYWNWDVFHEWDNIGAVSYLLIRGLFIYLVIRLIIVPITLWWF